MSRRSLPSRGQAAGPELLCPTETTRMPYHSLLAVACAVVMGGLVLATSVVADDSDDTLRSYLAKSDLVP